MKTKILILMFILSACSRPPVVNAPAIVPTQRPTVVIAATPTVIPTVIYKQNSNLVNTFVYDSYVYIAQKDSYVFICKARSFNGYKYASLNFPPYCVKTQGNTDEENLLCRLNANIANMYIASSDWSLLGKKVVNDSSYKMDACIKEADLIKSVGLTNK